MWRILNALVRILLPYLLILVALALRDLDILLRRPAPLRLRDLVLLLLGSWSLTGEGCRGLELPPSADRRLDRLLVRLRLSSSKNKGIESSVADPDPNPDPPDPSVFGPPGSGSGSITHGYGSTSGS
jgi:hypothetical protein